jgi:hypothetical protein
MHLQRVDYVDAFGACGLTFCWMRHVMARSRVGLARDT